MINKLPLIGVIVLIIVGVMLLIKEQSTKEIPIIITQKEQVYIFIETDTISKTNKSKFTKKTVTKPNGTKIELVTKERMTNETATKNTIRMDSTTTTTSVLPDKSYSLALTLPISKDPNPLRYSTIILGKRILGGFWINSTITPLTDTGPKVGIGIAYQF